MAGKKEGGRRTGLIVHHLNETRKSSSSCLERGDEEKTLP